MGDPDRPARHAFILAYRSAWIAIVVHSAQSVVLFGIVLSLVLNG